MEQSDEELPGVNVLESVNINQAVWKEAEASVLVTTGDKEFVLVDERVPEAETESESELVR